MNVIQQFESFRAALIGRKITFIRLACNSLLLYVDCKPGEEKGMTFWLEPTWHVSTSKEVVAVSLQAQGQGEDGPTADELDQVNKSLSPVLLNRAIKTIVVDDRSHDLTVTVEGKGCFRTFVSDPGDEEIWHVRDNATKLRFCASPSNFKIHKEPNQSRERTRYTRVAQASR